MDFESKGVALTAVFAALYVVINVVQMITIGNPTIYGPVQLRVSDCLIALAAILGLPVIIGVTFGCFLTNMFYFLGVQDVLFGSIANLIAAVVVFLLRKRLFLACVAGALPIGVIVGSYLQLFFQFEPPEILAFLPAFGGMVVSLTLSSLLAIAGLGYLLAVGLSRPSIIEPLKSRGLKVVLGDD